VLSLLQLDPGAYTASPLHSPDRTFQETNCYVDLWIELLHACGIDPRSMMSFALFVDFEGDQWTFFKPPPDALLRLYGIDVHEMQLYRPTVDHAVEQLRGGRTMIIEVDSFYLPDRAGTAYRRAHVKSSIAIEAIDPAGERLRYFHGAGYYELSGEDYRGVFRLGRAFSEDVLPPYVETVRFDSSRPRGVELRRAAKDEFAEQFRRRSRNNPWRAFGQRLAADLPGLLSGNDAKYHAYAFATLRQCGAAFECGADFLRWLGEPDPLEPISRQVAGAKSLLFRLARRKAFDPQPAIDQLAAEWDRLMADLEKLAVETPVEVGRGAV